MSTFKLSCSTETAQALASRTGKALRLATDIGHSTDYLNSLVTQAGTLSSDGWDWQHVWHFRDTLEGALTNSRDRDLTMYLMLVHAAFLGLKGEDSTATANACFTP